MKKRYGSFVIAGLFLFLLFSAILVLSNTFPGIKLSGVNPCTPTTCLATNPGYPANGNTIVNYNVQGDSVGGGANTETLKMPGCSDTANFGFCSVYTASGGTLYVPGGMIGDSHALVYCQLGICVPAQSIYWYVQDPPNIPLACVPNLGGSGTCADVRGSDVAATTTGASGGILLTSPSPTGDPSCTNPVNGKPSDNAPAGGCWASDWSIIQQAQIVNPPCLPGVTECLKWTVSQNMTVSAAIIYLQSHPPPNGVTIQMAVGPNYNCPTCVSNVIQTTGQTWYLYRLITDILLSYSPPVVEPQCNGGNSCTQCIGIGGGNCPDNGQLSSVVNNQFIPELNKVATVSGTRVVFGISITGLAAQCPTPVNPGSCFIGIAGMWLGGQSVQPAGCTVTTASCSITNANTGHYQFPLYQDSALTQSALVPSSADIISLASVSNQTIQQVQQSNLYSTVYSYVDIGAIGNKYTPAASGTCTVGALSQCIVTPTPVYINVPIIYDAIGSYTNFYYTYPGLPPNGGNNGGTISGHVYDAGSKNLIGQFSGLAGACVGVGGPCSGFTGQFQSPTDGNGFYLISPGNIPAGIYSISASASGFNTFTVPGVKVSVGTTTSIDFYLTSVTPPGQWCIIPPIPNPVPYQPPLFGGLCVPSWIIPVGIVIAVLGIVAIILTTPAGQALGFGGAALTSAAASRIRRQLGHTHINGLRNVRLSKI